MLWDGVWVLAGCGGFGRRQMTGRVAKFKMVSSSDLTNDNFSHVFVSVFVFDMSAETRLTTRYSYLCRPEPVSIWWSMIWHIVPNR